MSCLAALGKRSRQPFCRAALRVCHQGACRPALMASTEREHLCRPPLLLDGLLQSSQAVSQGARGRLVPRWQQHALQCAQCSAAGTQGHSGLSQLCSLSRRGGVLRWSAHTCTPDCPATGRQGLVQNRALTAQDMRTIQKAGISIRHHGPQTRSLNCHPHIATPFQGLTLSRGASWGCERVVPLWNVQAHLC